MTPAIPVQRCTYFCFRPLIYITRDLDSFYLKVAGNRIIISIYLCKEYAQSQATKTDNMRYVYENVQKYSVLPQ